MKKVTTNVMKRVQALYERIKVRYTRDGNSVSHVHQNDNESVHVRKTQTPERSEISFDKETRGYIKEENPQSGTHVQVKQNELPGITDTDGRDYEDPRAQIVPDINQYKQAGTMEMESSDDEGACGPVLDKSKTALVPISDGQLVNINDCPSGVHTSCGALEKKCFNQIQFPPDLQKKILHIKENLLWKYPPYYDFCVIASDDDYEEAIRFKNYVAASFGLAGCTLEDGFVNLGGELFDCYESMMDHSSKVFFFITENFTSSAFCKRLQSGAVFLSLMSKWKKDREKCVPVFPYGSQSGCRLPLSLSGISGLNLTQPETTRCSLTNTYSSDLRQCRYLLDLENFRKRCLEFETQVTKCIEDYNIYHIQNKLPIMSVAENDCVIDQECRPSLEAQTPVIELPENEDIVNQNFNRILSNGSSSERAVTIEKEIENPENDKFSRKDSPNLQNTEFNQNIESDKLENKENDDNCEKCSDKDDLWNNLPVPDEIREIVNSNNNVSSVSISDSGSVHVGHVINITFNQVSPSTVSNLEQTIKNQTTNVCEKEMSGQHSDSSDE